MSGPPANTRMPTRLSPGNNHVGAYERSFAPHWGDGPRIIALAAIPVAWALAGPASALTMLLVSGGTWAFRYYSRTRSEDILGQAVLLLGGMFSVLGTYKVIGWLDLAVHFLVLLALTNMLTGVLARHGMMPVPESARQSGGILLAVASMGVSLAVLWEIGEWAGHRFISTEVGVGYDDTLGDLMAGLLGALAAALWFHCSARRKGNHGHP